MADQTSPTEKQLTGKLPREAVRLLEVPRIQQDIIQGFIDLGDMTGTVSDTLDELGICGVVPATVLRPTFPGARVVGPALTLRNIEQTDQAYKGAKERLSRMAEIEAHNLSQPGDVLVIEGVDGVSNMGGISSAIAKRQGQAGAIVDGGIRDVIESNRLGLPGCAL